MSELFPGAAAKPRRRHDFIVPPGTDRAKCSSCGVAVAWIVTDSGSRMPLDLSSVHETPENTRRAESHFAHCPSASQHRRRDGAAHQSGAERATSTEPQHQHMPKSELIAVQPRWWIQASEQAAKLASSSARVAKLLPTIEPDQLTKEAIEVIESILTSFSETADALNLELSAVADGSSTYLIKGGKCDPGVDPTDLAGLAKAYLAGQVVGGDAIAEQVWDYGDGPDALPDAIESVAKRLRDLPPEKRKAAQVFVLLEGDAGGSATKAG